MKVGSVILKRTYAWAPIDTNMSSHGDLADADNLDRSRTRQSLAIPVADQVQNCETDRDVQDRSRLSGGGHLDGGKVVMYCVRCN